MATRGIGESRLDHGAQFFTVRDARFREAADRWKLANWVAAWFSEGGHVRYRAEGGMNALAKHLAKPFDVRTVAMVELAEPADEGWRVITEAGECLRAAALLLTPPAPQSIALLAACVDQGRLATVCREFSAALPLLVAPPDPGVAGLHPPGG